LILIKKQNIDISITSHILHRKHSVASAVHGYVNFQDKESISDFRCEDAENASKTCYNESRFIQIA